MTTATPTQVQPESEEAKLVIDHLIRSYWMEIETVQNYLAHSVNLDGVRAKRIKEALAEDIEEELGHAKKLADRIHVLGGIVPGSESFSADQHGLQPPSRSDDVISVINGVISAESDAINQYRKIIELTDGKDWVTQDLCIALQADEEKHRREFQGYLTEYEAG